MNQLKLLSTFTLLLVLTGCGGTKLLKDPEPLVVTQALATASNAQLSVALDWVIYRDGPGTWASANPSHPSGTAQYGPKCIDRGRWMLRLLGVSRGGSLSKARPGIRASSLRCA